MLRLAHHGVDRSDLAHAAVVQDCDLVCHVVDQPEVVRDEEHRDTLVVDERAEEPDDAGLHRDVQCRGHLVADQHVW
ncbi:MAG: hypothetical protein AAGG08_16170, partial [Actinomycetota bacterium]